MVERFRVYIVMPGVFEQVVLDGNAAFELPVYPAAVIFVVEVMFLIGVKDENRASDIICEIDGNEVVESFVIGVTRESLRFLVGGQ